MKQVIHSVVFLVFILCGNRVFGQTDSLISFNEKKIDFGDIIQDSIVSHVFTFKNNTQEYVSIVDVITQCGCTTSSNEFSSIAPDSTGTVEIVFDSEGKDGYQRKAINIKFDNFLSRKLLITANILKE